MKKLIIIALMSLLSTACSIKTHYIQSGSSSFSKTNPSDIKVYANPEVKDNYEVIGSLAVHVPGNGSKAAMEMKKEAAKIGANAIIGFQLDKFNSIAKDVTQAHGIAIRIK